MYLFGRFGGEALYVKEPRLHVHESGADAAGPAKRHLLSETDWVFLVLLTLSVANNNSLAPPHAAATDALAAGAAAALLSGLQQALLAYATVQLHSAPLVEKPLAFAAVVLCRRPFLWDVLRHVDALAQQLAHATAPDTDGDAPTAADDEAFRARLLRPLQRRWGALVALYASLTDVQPPSDASNSDPSAQLAFRAYRATMTACRKMETERWGSPYLLESREEVGASATLSTRLEYVRLLDQLVRHHARTAPRGKRTREDGGELQLLHRGLLAATSFLERQCYATPGVAYTRYLCDTFLPLYDERCFALLLPDRQRRLTRVLQALHRWMDGTGLGDARAVEEEIAAAVNDSNRVWRATDAHYVNPFLRTAAPPTATTTTAGAAPQPAQEAEEKEEVFWSSDDEVEEPPRAIPPPPAPLATAAVTASAGWLQEHAMLRQDSRIVMLVAHSVFVLLQRFGSISAEDQAVLLEDTIPLLLHLSDTSKDRWHAQRTADGDGASEQLHRRCARFCLYAFIVAEVVAIEWDVHKVGLMWLRYETLVHYVLDRCAAAGGAGTLIDRALPELEGWVREGAGSPKSRAHGTHAAAFLEEIDTLLRQNNPTYLRMSDSRAAAGSAVLDHCLRCVTPLRPPPACALLLVLSAYRTLSQRLRRLRADLEEQRRLADEEGNLEYLDRTETYCTAQDCGVLRAIVLSVHRCVFGHTLQSLGLLRLWMGYLAHLLRDVVPRPHSAEAMALMPRSWQVGAQVRNCLGDRVLRVGWRALRPSSAQSSQTALRVAVGELLADLALLPLADAAAAQSCPCVFPLGRAYAEPEVEAFAAAERAAAAQDTAVLQRLLPVAVLEELCLFLGVETGRAGAAAAGQPRAAGMRLEESFLGLAGVCAFCKRWEACVPPGAVTDPRVVHLLRCVWAAVDAVVALGS
ncbi:hypothetical protein STCU_11993 [Strigomonas culicis]|uniref:Uncharacterized protein n=1 Tax=Strigomonas culicis TaxID=28005 RepID=S9TEW1_9TRYP|nr:hypothetical protein STCU_11993 [Strigomonas culicis]|eukprot:EPY15479.1 hypothetical protein STCU_11993 [Strigomonas culicis]